MKAIANTLRISPYKLNLVAGLVRNKMALDALTILKFTPKKGAAMLYKVVQSAIANAENNFKQDATTLYLKEIIVNKGMMMKRGVPISKGRVNPILKRNSHITVIIGVAEGKTVTTGKKGKTSATPKTDSRDQKQEAKPKKTTTKKDSSKKPATT